MVLLPSLQHLKIEMVLLPSLQHLDWDGIIT